MFWFNRKLRNRIARLETQVSSLQSGLDAIDMSIIQAKLNESIAARNHSETKRLQQQQRLIKARGRV